MQAFIVFESRISLSRIKNALSGAFFRVNGLKYSVFIKN